MCIHARTCVYFLRPKLKDMVNKKKKNMSHTMKRHAEEQYKKYDQDIMDYPDRIELTVDEYDIIMNRAENRTWLCYIVLPDSHPLAHLRLDLTNNKFDIHGGITYHKNNTIGFDHQHECDVGAEMFFYGDEYIFGKEYRTYEYAFNEVCKLYKFVDGMSSGLTRGEVRTFYSFDDDTDIEHVLNEFFIEVNEEEGNTFYSPLYLPDPKFTYNYELKKFVQRIDAEEEDDEEEDDYVDKVYGFEAEE